jgi:hypothetical protein
LLADPAATLKAEGVNIEMPAGVTLKFVEDTDKLRHMVLPAKPADSELSEEELDAVAGGTLTLVSWATRLFCGDSVCIRA